MWNEVRRPETPDCGKRTVFSDSFPQPSLTESSHAKTAILLKDLRRFDHEIHTNYYHYY